MIREAILLAEGMSASWSTVIAVGTLLLGTTGTTLVAVVQWLSNRGKNKSDATKSIVEAAASLLGPYSTALDMANNQIKHLNELDKAKTLRIRNLEKDNRRNESRIEELEEKLAAYEARFGPLTTKHHG